jgi:hypothetical protein
VIPAGSIAGALQEGPVVRFSAAGVWAVGSTLAARSFFERHKLFFVTLAPPQGLAAAQTG